MKRETIEKISRIDAEEILRGLDLCPYADVCAVENGSDDICKHECYEDCSIYQDYIKNNRES